MSNTVYESIDNKEDEIEVKRTGKIKTLLGRPKVSKENRSESVDLGLSVSVE